MPRAARKPPPPPEDELQRWLREHAAEYTLLENGKLRCTLTSTDLPLSLPILRAHWAGRAYRRALLGPSAPLDVSVYDHIVPHHSLQTRVYCTLTKTTLNARKVEVEAHIRGKRYLSELRKLEQRELERQERERRRKEKRERQESGKDEGVEERLPEEVLLGDEDDEEEEDGDTDAAGGARLMRELDEDEGIPLIRTKAVQRKRKRGEHPDEEEEQDEDDRASSLAEEHSDGAEEDALDDHEPAADHEQAEDDEDGEDDEDADVPPPSPPSRPSRARRVNARAVAAQSTPKRVKRNTSIPQTNGSHSAAGASLNGHARSHAKRGRPRGKARIEH